MVKSPQILIEACQFFLADNDLKVYKTEFGHKRIYLNGSRIFQKELGSIIFTYCEMRRPFKKKWSTLTTDLCKQSLSMI